jgi:hypothetical protein
MNERRVGITGLFCLSNYNKYQTLIAFCSLEYYYGDYEGVDTVTLSIAGTETNKETSFVVPKYALMFASPVFCRMFAYEMTEKTTGKVEIKDTNPDEFGDFLKAISPMQEHPNRKIFWMTLSI